ncbi:MAG: HDIG domain-containing protein [Desulfobacterales bacterium]
MIREKRKKKISHWFTKSQHVRWIILLVISAIIAFLFYPSLGGIEHVYDVGDVAKRNIKAPKDFFVEDKVASEDKRNDAVEKILTVYDFNQALMLRLAENIDEAFSDMRAYHNTASNLTDDRLADHQKFVENQSAEKQNDSDTVWGKKEEFEKKLGINISPEAYSLLVKHNFAATVAEKIISIITEIYQNGVVANKEFLLKESDKGIVLRNLSLKTESVEQSLKRYYEVGQAQTMVQVVGESQLKGFDQQLKQLIVDFSQKLIQPNITLNRDETEKRKKDAAEAIQPVLFRVKAGEMILREGDRVTDLHLLKINALHSKMKQEKIVATSIGASALFGVFLMVLYLLNLQNNCLIAGNHNKNLLFLASILIVFILIGKVSASIVETLPRNLAYSLSPSSIVYGVPIASGAMVICLFMGVEIAVAFALIISVFVTVIFNNQFDLFIYFFLNSAMGAYWVRHCRERKVFAKAGLYLGLLNIFLAGCIGLVNGDFLRFDFVWNLFFAFLGGISAGILTSGMAVLFETLFGYATDITLLELANLERPILRRLMIEAPGTYHHSVIVGSLVEAAASDIGANPLLAKVCGYYHDIGKIKKPFYFIENQTRGKNLHDKLAPSMSRRILIAHVKDGIDMAGEHKLPHVVRSAIEQHHGTSLIRYFFDKAVKLQGDKSVKADDYRYPGPNPQTREAGLVMLADVVEAASRTLDDPTPARIQGLVQNLINKIFSDGQLNDCELTLKDLHSIAKSFNKILNGIHHHRVEYAESPARSNGKSKNGNSDQQQPKEKKDSNRQNSDSSTGHLKRLGLS